MIGKQRKNNTRNDFVVLGLGTFGLTVARELIKSGAHVKAIDRDEKKVEEASEFAIDVMIADAREKKALVEAGISNMDVGIVSMGEELEASFLATLHLKEMGVPYIITKATTRAQGEILVKIGADRVIFPEEEMAQKLAEQLRSPSILNFLTLSENVDIVETPTPDIFKGKTLKDISLRNKYGLNLIAIRRTKMKEGTENMEEEVITVPAADEEIKEGDILIVIGRSDYLEEFMNMQRESNGINNT